MSDGFLGRWSKRKLDAKEGKPVDAEPSLPSPQSSPASGRGSEDTGIAGPPCAGEGTTEVPVEAPPLTLDDVEVLTPESDFTRFAAADVAPEVKNAAMKKLFADPRYNVMDMMDVYVDDYSKPDPIPHAMLRQLVSAKFLGLFDKEEQQEADAAEAAKQAALDARDVADNPTAQSVAQSEAIPPAVPEPADHDDPDLRLQQDHAAPGKDPGRGIG